MYRLLGRMHASLLGLRRDAGQGTVEYVIIGKIKEAVRKVQF
jgi:hypothetical protein